MRMQEFMTKGVATARPKETADAAWERMQGKNCHHLIVKDKGAVVGVLSARDLGGARGKARRKNRAVSELMTPAPVVAKPTTTVRQAANLMRGHAIGCLPIVDQGKLKGIVTVSDLLELLGRGTERPASAVRERTSRKAAPRRGSPPRGSG